MTSVGKINMDDQYRHNIQEFFVSSWTIQEYYKAISSDEFFESIKEYLDSSSTIETERNDLIDSKYFFAGGCARFMFGYKTSRVTLALDQSIQSISDIIPYIQGTIGDHSDSVVNRLF